MTKIGLYTATENELGAVQKAASRLDTVEPRVRSEGDLDDQTDVAEFVDEIQDAACAVLWLHGAEDSMPAYDYAVEALDEAGVPVVVKATGDAYALEDTTVVEEDRDEVYSYLDRGGTVNLANCMRYLAREYAGDDVDVEPPRELPTEGVYHPDHPGASVDEVLESHDPDRPTVGVWFYESHWTHENTRYVDAQVRAIEEQGANALPVFCNPAADEEDQEDAGWTARNIFTRDDEVVVDAVLSSFMFSMAMSERGRSASDEGDVEAAFLKELDVPVLQTVTTMRSRGRYRSSDTGVMGFELALSVALPEFDGNVVTHPISGKERTEDTAGVGSAPKQHHAIEGRVEHAAELAVNWAGLRHKSERDRRVAVVLHNYPPRDDGIGTAFGLDTPRSTVNLLQELDGRGYSVGDPPEDGGQLIDRLTSQLTLDSRWVAPEDVRDRAVDVVEPMEYAGWYGDADERFRDDMEDEWGEPPDRPFAIPGVELGNVLVTVQPPRGFGVDPEKIYHDSDLMPPHDYYAFYSWMKHEFEADAVVHMGTHGSLEWLPGKTVGLDGGCAPDALVGGLPNVYPYVINNPGEGTQAKRRSYAAVVDHLTPPMRRADSYGELAELEELARSYREAGAEARVGREKIVERVRELVDSLDLALELGVEGTVDEQADVRGPDEAGTTLAEGRVDGDTVDDDELVERVHAYVTDVRDTQIRMGLHSLGEPPSDDVLVDYLVALTRLENPGAPSLREAVAGVLGVPLQRMLEHPEEFDTALGMTLSEAADRVHETSRELVKTLAEHGFDVPESEADADEDDEVNMNLLVVDVEPIGDGRAEGGAHDDLREVLEYICTVAAPKVEEASVEVSRVADALDGHRVPPGGSGAPTRGGVDLLPSGRNFYTLDPRKVPARTAWEVGRRVADDTLERHLDEEDEYPEEVGVVAWGTPTVRTRGETIAEVLALMGVEPRWTDAGRVDTVEPIPLDELDRPRVDVTTRVSGLFRDAFPQAASVVHDAVEAVVELDEPHDMNYVKKHVEEETEELVEEGVDETDARAEAMHRVFTTRPGGYGAGTNKAVDEGEWDTREDLSEVYVSWGGYALGSRGNVEEAEDSFRRRLGNVDATLKTEDTMEQDEFDSSDWYAFHGGFITAVAEHAGEEPASYVGDTSDPDNPVVYTNEEKVRKAMRARALNPDWLDSMEEHGYKGAGDLSKTVEVALGWDATTGVVSDALWRDVADRYAFDDDRQSWMLDVNPWALENITSTLLEAVDRGLWDADDDVVDRIRDVNLRADGVLEDDASREREVVADDD